MLLRVLVLMILAAAPAALAQPLPQGLAAGPRAVVAEVVDGDTLVLEDGHQVRLVGIMAPKLSLGRTTVADQPFGEEAKATLAALVEGRAVTLHWGETRMDRHGRQLAHLVLDDGTWVQGRLLALGLARVYTFADNRQAVADMLALEEEARSAGLGLWSSPFFAVRDAGRPREVGIERFEIVEGVVAEAAEVDGRVFLNFGEDWATDLTATISPRDRATFRAAHVDPLALEGRHVRLRGWTGWRNGPNIELDHPEQIEILD